MDPLFLLNPNATLLDLKDGIDERLNKAKGILNCLMFSIEHIQNHQELNNSSAYHVLWAVEAYIDEIRYIENKIYEIKNNH